MEHLNYCRQILRSRNNGTLLIFEDDRNTERGFALAAMDAFSCSVKFILPNGGRVMMDESLKALDGNEKLRLPFESIVLEFPMIAGRDGVQSSSPMHKVTKRVVLATEVNDDVLTLSVFGYTESSKEWAFLGVLGLARDDWMRRDENGTPVEFAVRGLSSKKLKVSMFLDEVLALFMMLNALNCSNVHIAKSAAKSEGKKIKSALPFDSYHFLTVDVPKKPGAATGRRIDGRAPPREHLRRGHIRTFDDGRRFWINAAVVGAGNGGKIHKDYVIRRAA